MEITLDCQNLKGHVDDKEYKSLFPAIEKAHKDLENRTGKGAEFTGWLDLPERMDNQPGNVGSPISFA